MQQEMKATVNVGHKSQLGPCKQEERAGVLQFGQRCRRVHPAGVSQPPEPPRSSCTRTPTARNKARQRKRAQVIPAACLVHVGSYLNITIPRALRWHHGCAQSAAAGLLGCAGGCVQ